MVLNWIEKAHQAERQSLPGNQVVDWRNFSKNGHFSITVAVAERKERRFVYGVPVKGVDALEDIAEHLKSMGYQEKNQIKFYRNIFCIQI